MKRASAMAVFLLLVGATAAAQAPPATAAPPAEMGYAYVLPADWTVVAVKPHSPAETAPQQSLASQDSIKDLIKGTACIRVPLTAQHGAPASVIVVVELPFACYGQTMTEQDLAGFGSGAADGLKQVYELLDPVYGVYSLGSHHLWIERAKGSPKGHPETQYTMEIACSLLKKGAACWMTMAADEASLHAFESAPVTLEDEAPTPLVPATAFDQAPHS
jgi:hypothetical protein